jgi:hypothetical protein
LKIFGKIMKRIKERKRRKMKKKILHFGKNKERQLNLLKYDKKV